MSRYTGQTAAIPTLIPVGTELRSSSPPMSSGGSLTSGQLVLHTRSIDDLIKQQSQNELYKSWRKGHRRWLAKRNEASESNTIDLPEPNEAIALTANDVIKLSEALQERLSRRKTYEIVEKIRPLVKGIEAYGEALTTYANASSTILCPLWGSLQVLLTIASRVTDSFDALLDMLRDIAEILPRLEQYATAFQGRTTFEAALVMVYNDISLFLQKSIEFYCRRGLVTLWHGLWRPFQEDFGHITTQLRKHIELVDKAACISGFQAHQEAQQATFDALDSHIKHSLRYQNDAMLQQSTSREMMEILQLREVTKWLSPVMPHVALQRAQSKIHPNTGAWLIDNPRFLAWIMAPKNAVLPVLWVHGSPGCGKTILAARVISYLKQYMLDHQVEDEKYILGYFFCDHNDSAQTTRLAVAKSIVGQILASNTNLLPFAVKEMRESGEEEVTSAPRLFSLAKALLTSFLNGFILIDALDECTLGEREILLRDLNDLADTRTTTKVLILSRHEADIKKALASYPSYAITSKDTSTDINRFVSESLENTSAFKFHIQPQMKSELQKQLSQSADGSFLWVRLMIDTLKSHPLDNFNQVRDAVVHLPLGLSAAYGRVFINLLRQSKGIQDLICLVLQLLSISFRPMTVTSLLSTLVRHGDIPWDNLKSEENFRTLLEETIGTITQVTSEGTLSFIHQTVAEFLTSSTELWTGSHKNIVRFKVDGLIANSMMAVRCLDTLEAIVYTIDQDAVSVIHKPGDFTSYSMDYWVEHVSLSQRPNREISNRIKLFLSSDQSLYWLKERLQAPAKEAVTIGQLIVLEHKLKEWAKKGPEQVGLQDVVDDFVQRLYRKWHAQLCSKYGENSHLVLRSSNLLGQILTNKGRYREATSVFEKHMVPATCEKIERLTYLNSLIGLAQVRQNQGNWEGAVEILHEAVDGLKSALPLNDQKTLAVQGMLGSALVGASRHRVGEEREALAEAEYVLMETQKARTEILGASHPETLEGLQTLAKLYSFQGRFEDSKNAFLQYQDIAKKVLGVEHRNYLHSLDDLGVLYTENVHFAEAEATLEYVSSIHKSVQGEKHPDTAWSYWRLGVVLREQGKLDRAIEALLPLSEISGEIYGEKNRYCLMSRYQLAMAYDALKQDSKSRPLFEHVIENADFKNKVSFNMGLSSAPKLADIYERAGRKRWAKSLRQKTWVFGQEPPKKPASGLRSLIDCCFDFKSRVNVVFVLVILFLLLIGLGRPDVWLSNSWEDFFRAQGT